MITGLCVVLAIPLFLIMMMGGMSNSTGAKVLSLLCLWALIGLYALNHFQTKAFKKANLKSQAESSRSSR